MDKEIYLKKGDSVYKIRDIQTYLDGKRGTHALVYVDFVKGEVDESEFFSCYILEESIREAAEANEYEMIDFTPTILDWFRKYFKFELSEKECHLLIEILRSETFDFSCDGYEVEIGSDGIVEHTFRDYDPDRLGLINYCKELQEDFLNENSGDIGDFDKNAIEQDIGLLNALLIKFGKWEKEE